MQDGAGGDVHLLLNILADGQEQARQLGEPDDLQSRARQLQCTFEKAIAVAKAIEAAGASGSRGTDRSDSPRSADESSGRTARDVAQVRQDMCKRRKGLPRWTEKFRVPDASLEATPDDGFSWRKYGQKDILGAKFPRGYYRCTYRNAQGCPATKQVQRSDSDLSMFDVTYQGVHTCHQKQRHATTSPPGGAVAAHDGNQPPQPLRDPNLELLASFKNDLKVETEGLTLTASFHEHDHDAATTASFAFPSVPFHAPVRPPDNAAASFSPVVSGQLGGGFSPAFVSPAASAGSSYFSVAQCQVGSYDLGGVGMRGAESELGEVVSAATASAVDPARFDYSLYHHHAESDPHLPFAPIFGHPSHGQHRNE